MFENLEMSYRKAYDFKNLCVSLYLVINFKSCCLNFFKKIFHLCLLHALILVFPLSFIYSLFIILYYISDVIDINKEVLTVEDTSKKLWQ